MSKNTKTVRARVQAAIDGMAPGIARKMLMELNEQTLSETEFEARVRNLGWLDTKGNMRKKPVLPTADQFEYLQRGGWVDKRHRLTQQAIEVELAARAMDVDSGATFGGEVRQMWQCYIRPEDLEEIKPKPTKLGKAGSPEAYTSPVIQTDNALSDTLYNLSQANEKILELRMACLDRAISTVTSSAKSTDDSRNTPQRVVDTAELYMKFLVAGEIKMPGAS